MAEWLKAHAWKACIGETLSRVRIPVSPPDTFGPATLHTKLSSIAVSPRTTKLNWSQLYLCVALTTLATLLLELALTRIFSVVFYYHFAFLAISIALFGLGAGGVFSYVVADWPGNLYSKLGMLGLINALCVVASLWFVVSRPPDAGTGSLAAIYVASAL